MRAAGACDPAADAVGGRTESVGLAHSVRRRCGGRADLAVPAQIARRNVDERVARQEGCGHDPRRVAAQGRVLHGGRLHGGRLADLLYVHDVHAEVPGQHRRHACEDGQQRDDRRAARLHADATGVRRAVRQDRPPHVDDPVRHVCGDRHGAADARAEDRDEPDGRIRARYRRAGDRQLLHVDQRPHQGRDVPARSARDGRRPVVRGRERDLRRFGRIRRAVVQVDRQRGNVLLVRDRAVRDLADRVVADARSEQGRVSASRAVIGWAATLPAPVRRTETALRHAGGAPFFHAWRVRIAACKLIARPAISISKSLRCSPRTMLLFCTRSSCDTSLTGIRARCVQRAFFCVFAECAAAVHASSRNPQSKAPFVGSKLPNALIR
ncbi:hypothetical protein BLAT2472_10835 [Burkholderia latens]